MMMMTMKTAPQLKRSLLGALLFFCLPLCAQAQNKDEDSNGVRFVFKNNPSLRFGKILRIDFRWKMQADIREFSPKLTTNEGEFDMQRARAGIEGNFLKHFEYEVERELREYVGGREPSYPWRDVKLNFRYFSNIQIQIGKFKIPFGLEQTTGTMNLDFVQRARTSDTLTPAREIGGMAHGRFFKRGLNYEAGVFRHDGENSERSLVEPRARRTYVARVTATPLRLLPLPKLLKEVEFGAAGASSRVPEGLTGIHGQTSSGDTFFPHKNDSIWVRGTRFRIGTQIEWTPGPFSLKSEFIHVRDHRMGQSLREANLPPLLARGWYAAGTWVVTGEAKAGGIEPRRPLFVDGGFGAIELAARFETLRFGSSQHLTASSRSPRASNILGNSDRVWTAGVNWYLNRFTKIQVNAVHDKVEDIQRSPILGRQDYWMGIMRLQFVM